MATFSTDHITGVEKMKVSTERVFVNADRSKVAKEGSDEAAFLLVGEGGQISDEDAEKFGVKTTEAPEGPAPDNTAPHMFNEDGSRKEGAPLERPTDESSEAPAAKAPAPAKKAAKGTAKRK